jgi:two-component system phosphate regulon sensor histidine kinase PhoR
VRVRQVKNLQILAVLLAVGGIALLVMAAELAVGDEQTQRWLWAGGATLVAANMAWLIVAGTSRRDAIALASAMRLRATTEAMEPLDVAATTQTRIAEAANEIITVARTVIGDAQAQVKGYEIQVKVATAERQHAEAIIKSISDAVLVTSAFDELVLANDAAAKTFNFDLPKAHRTPVDQILRDPKMVELIRDMRQSKTVNGRRIVEHMVRATPGSSGDRTYKVTLSGVAGTAGDPAGVVAVLHDMTREKEVAEMKNDFVSNVSHELRTPLASIKAYVEMLIDGEADDERTKSEFYEIIQGEANRLGRLIDNILNISRIESGLVKINKQPQSISVIVKEAVDVINPQAKLKQIALDEQLCPVFYQTFVDKDMIYQAVLNILSNSVKYTPDGGTVTVQVKVDETQKKVLVKIIDTGVGIPPKDLPFVFDKFYRVETNNKMAKGTGLGLSLVKHIVETVHHGRATVNSEIGKGTTFGIELDLHE